MSDPQTTERLCVWHCLHCKWTSEPQTFGATSNNCSNCHKPGLRYIIYDPKTETEEVHKILNDAT